MLAEAAGLELAALIRDPDRAVSVEPYRSFIERRSLREPLAYIVGWQEFWSLRFAVSPATLIPRADSETLIEAALATRPDGVGRVLDLGTGTGCLLLAALSEYRDAWGVGVDLRPAAAALAQRNARALGMAGRASMVSGSWGAALGERFDLVLCNPPYIDAAEITGLMPEVAGFEPRSALDGGTDGLDAYRAILAGLPELVAPDGVAVLELGAGQCRSVIALAEAAGLTIIAIRRDLAGVDRALVLG